MDLPAGATVGPVVSLQLAGRCGFADDIQDESAQVDWAAIPNREPGFVSKHPRDLIGAVIFCDDVRRHKVACRLRCLKMQMQLAVTLPDRRGGLDWVWSLTCFRVGPHRFDREIPSADEDGTLGRIRPFIGGRLH